jgi:hypothetical protein
MEPAIIQSCTVKLKIGLVHFVLCPEQVRTEKEIQEYMRFLSENDVYPAILLERENEGKYISKSTHIFPESHRSEPLSWEAPIWDFEFRSKKLLKK